MSARGSGEPCPSCGRPLPLPRSQTGADQKAAARLGITIDELRDACDSLFSLTFAEERDRRMGFIGARAEPRSLQARRGHVARKLIAELADSEPVRYYRRAGE